MNMWQSSLNDECSESHCCAEEAPPTATIGNTASDSMNDGSRNCAHAAKVSVSTVPSPSPPTVEPYVGKLERFELFSTNQCYYLVGCNKQNTAYRVLKMDRTLIERPAAATATAPAVGSTTAAVNAESWSNAHSSYRSGDASPHHQSDHPSHRSASSLGDPRDALHHNYHHPIDSPGPGVSSTSTVDTQHAHTAKPTLRPLADFLTEDPNVYTQEEIKEMLDMIHDGNRMASRSRRQPLEQHETASGGGGGGGLQPLVKAYGIVGFIRFLDCYYLTLTTRRTKVGSIGDHGIFTIKVRVCPAQ
jgi:hypothetical protein